MASRYKDSSTFFRKLRKKQGCAPRMMVTDQLKSDEAAQKQVRKRMKH
ncbi:hypothetical protein [Leptolyngbya sp. FACHB-321]|nr:hypothetical protein [Leptolyngbya sp. FACHB-321]